MTSVKSPTKLHAPSCTKEDSKKSTKDLTKCIICQKKQDNKGNKKLTSTENGRNAIFNCSKSLNDDLLKEIPLSQYDDINYHVNTCYPRYVRSKERFESRNETATSTEDLEVKPKRKKSNVSSPPPLAEKPCVICNHIKFKGDLKRFRICEIRRANSFLSAIKFNKDAVYDRCVLLKCPGDIFAADIVYHRKCLNGYIVKFERDIEAIMYTRNEHHEGAVFANTFKNFLSTLDLKKHAYSMSFCRDQLNEILEKEHNSEAYVTNRTLKTLLIDNFGEELSFTYPKDRKKSQMFYLSDTHTTATVIETMRSNNPIEVCANKLRSECENFDFNLDNSFRYASDLELSLQYYHSSSALPYWEKFFKILFSNRSYSEQIKRKCDVIFQIVFNLIKDGQKKTPLHTAIAQCIHDTCKSKNLIQILNRLGLCISYDDLERIDIGITQHTIDIAGTNRVPISKSVTSTSIIHGATDNFDHDENTPSGIGGSHDTILMRTVRGTQ
ncbi:uncharacterized protein LOC130636171 isoform X1 [Hydractinia symbiolongicarpus]|uniref:uncharacterized protein LOC130636171 isoform X1 n=1 Tax=Hydractinia symbiolongicarpus TaxID=13093 RepID=UPI00254C2786|nr:uncharacterized protein LOC130636171 isoform X1 [Hydractinia symbiolongicarpus]